jgi:hypothetical protein
MVKEMLKLTGKRADRKRTISLDAVENAGLKLGYGNKNSRAFVEKDASFIRPS